MNWGRERSCVGALSRVCVCSGVERVSPLRLVSCFASSITHRAHREPHSNPPHLSPHVHGGWPPPCNPPLSRHVSRGARSRNSPTPSTPSPLRSPFDFVASSSAHAWGRLPPCNPPPSRQAAVEPCLACTTTPSPHPIRRLLPVAADARGEPQASGAGGSCPSMYNSPSDGVWAARKRVRSRTYSGGRGRSPREGGRPCSHLHPRGIVQDEGERTGDTPRHPAVLRTTTTRRRRRDGGEVG